MVPIFVALGSNLGDRALNLAMARHRLAEPRWLQLGPCSSQYETEPWGPVAQGWYLNQVCQGWTPLAPRALIRWLQTVEQLGGRDRSREVRWGPRPIDIDLLAYNGEVYRDHMVEVPHPRLHERRFVLEPLAEIAPDWRHPLLGITVREMLARVEDGGQVERKV